MEDAKFTKLNGIEKAIILGVLGTGVLGSFSLCWLAFVCAVRMTQKVLGYE